MMDFLSIVILSINYQLSSLLLGNKPVLKPGAGLLLFLKNLIMKSGRFEAYQPPAFLMK